MSDKPCFSVAVAGLDAQHLRLIEVVFRHIQYNRFAYRLAAPYEEAASDLLIAGVGDPAGREALERARARGCPAATISVIGPEGGAAGRHAIEIGQLVRQLLPILNRVVELEGLDGGPRRKRGAPPAVGSADPVVPEVRGERARVLVIDRDETARARTWAALDRLGFEADAAATAAEALERLVIRPADVALLDPALSDGDGLKLVRTIHREPEWQALPIVVLSERRSPLDVIRGAFAGCSAYLAKPVDDEDLRRTLVRQLGGADTASRRVRRTRLVDAPAPAAR
ncbi:MAG: hypothetical protein RJA99_4321 [Pseudomonadota bacterium]|jgi:CheY-like chemotaxis protein